MKDIVKYVLSTVFFLAAISIHAQSEMEKLGMEANDIAALGGLKIGDIAPDIVTKGNNGEMFSLYEALDEGEVVLIFYRGYWCPVCSRHLSAFEKDLDRLREKNIRAIAITPETYEWVDKTVEKSNSTLLILSDPDNKIMKDYKVFYTVTDDYQGKIKEHLDADIALTNNQADAALPVPATYLIGQDRKIKFVHYDINYRKRASVDDIIRAIE